MKRRFIVPFAALAVFFITACSSDYNSLIRESENRFNKGEFLEAARTLLPQVNTADKNQLLFMMEAGLMLHAGGEYKKSTDVLTLAAKLVEQMPVRVSQQAMALLLNETSTNYRGEDHERVLVHMYLGLNRLMMSDGEGARVDFKKTNDYLRELVQKGGRAYKQNIMAKYLTGIAFEITADADNDESDREFAYIEYKQIQSLSRNLPMVYFDLQRVARAMNDAEDFRRWVGISGTNHLLNIPKGGGEFVLVFQSGQGAVKVSRGPLMSDRTMANGIRVAMNGLSGQQALAASAIMISLNKAENPIPKFQKRGSRVQYCEIIVNDQKYGRSFMLENIEDTAVKNLEEDYARIVGQAAAGIVTKVAVAVVAGIATRKAMEQNQRLGPWAGLAGALVGAGTGAALISQIKPDLRCWHSLPANLQMGRMYLPPGEHLLTINLIDRSGGVVNTVERKVTIESGKRNFFNLRTLF